MKLHTWYIADNGWNSEWFIGVSEDEWIVFDPHQSGSLSTVDEVNTDLFGDDLTVSVDEVSDQRDIYRDVFDAIFSDTVDFML